MYKMQVLHTNLNDVSKIGLQMKGAVEIKIKNEDFTIVLIP